LYGGVYEIFYFIRRSIRCNVELNKYEKLKILIDSSRHQVSSPPAWWMGIISGDYQTYYERMYDKRAILEYAKI